MLERKPELAIWIATLLMVALLAYPLSAGPVCWLWFHGLLPSELPVCRIFSPAFAASSRIEPVRDAYLWYVKAGKPENPMAELMFLKAQLEWHEQYPGVIPSPFDFVCGTPSAYD